MPSSAHLAHLCTAAVAQLSKWRKAFEQKRGRAPTHDDCAAGKRPPCIACVACQRCCGRTARRLSSLARLHALLLQICAHVCAAGMLPLLKMAKAKLDDRMKQQHQKSASPAPVSPAIPHAPLPVVSSRQHTSPTAETSGGISQPLPAPAPPLLSPVAPHSRASPLLFTSTPGTVVKNRNSIYPASLSTSSPLSSASKPATSTHSSSRAVQSQPPPLLQAPDASTARPDVLVAAAPESEGLKSARSWAGGGWSASAFAQSRPRGAILLQENETRDERTGDAAAEPDVGSIGNIPEVVCFTF